MCFLILLFLNFLKHDFMIPFQNFVLIFWIFCCLLFNFHPLLSLRDIVSQLENFFIIHFLDLFQIEYQFFNIIAKLIAEISYLNTSAYMTKWYSADSNRPKKIWNLNFFKSICVEDRQKVMRANVMPELNWCNFFKLNSSPKFCPKTTLKLPN